MSMSELQRAFVTTAGKTYKKVEGKDGRTYRFKDGTPIGQASWNAAQQHIKQEGQNVQVAVPSDKGPGYERKEVSQKEASALGQNLAILRNKRHAEATTDKAIRTDTFTIDGEEYQLDELYDLNDRIVDRHGSNAVFRYT